MRMRALRADRIPASARNAQAAGEGVGGVERCVKSDAMKGVAGSGVRFSGSGPGGCGGDTGLTGRLWKMAMPLVLAACFCSGLRAQVGAQVRAGTRLTVDVRLTEGAHGDLAYLIFCSATGFPGERDKAIRHGFLPIPPGAMQMNFHADLPPGVYAVSLYEDLNGNHKLDHNFLGIPREPVGASNNPPGRMGPPRYRDCCFRVGAQPKEITIMMVNGL